MKYRIFLFLYIAFFIIPAGYAKDSSFANILHEMEHAGFTIRHHKEGASDKTIVLIEDAHTNYPAQKELARIIEQLTAATTIQVIAVEGSEGEILTHFFASFPIEKTRRHLADNLLKNGFISGEEYLSISSGAPLRIVGVDDRVLYKQNIEHFRDFYHARPQAHPLISQIQNGLFKAKVTAYDSILFKFDTACLSFKDGSVDLTHFLEVCEHLVPDADKLFFDFPLLNDVRIIAQQHTAFNFDTLYAQAAQAAKLIIQNGTPEQANTAREALLKNMAGKTTHSSFYRQLIVQAENNPAIDISGLNELQRYVALSEELSQIDHSVLQDEIDGFVEVCYQRLLSTAEEKELHALSSNFETLNQLYSLSLIRSDYLSMQQSTQIAEFVESFIAGYNTAAPASRISPDNTAFLAKILANNLAFYQTAVQRDTVIFENTLSLMEQQQCTATVLIAGGFHKDHIIASCAEQEIGCIVISPATAGEQDFNQYASVVLRNDRFIQPPQPDKTQGNYLRASSFFAQSSFDSAQHITAFRNNFIFEAVLDSIDTIGAGEIHSIIKAWRSGFIKALAQHHPENSPTYQNAVSIFDYLVTDVFAAGNIEAHPESNTVILFSMGQTLKISRTGETGVSVEPIAGHYLSHELEKSFALISDPLALRNSEVFIAGWVITDGQSPYKGHGDAHYAVKFIEALNLRGIAPAVIIPFDPDQRIAAIKKYLTALSPQTHQFQFITYNEDTGEGFHAVDAEGTLLSPYVLSPERRPIVLDLASSIDPDRNQRLKTIQNQILQTYSTLQTTAHQAPPAIIITTPDTPFYDTLREIAQAELQNAAVFVSAWMPADDGTPEINQDLLPKIARIITYLNQRGIVPLLPIPSFSPLNNKARREFIQYISRHLTSRDRVQYVTFDELGSNSFITVDSTGRLLTAHTIGTQSPAIIVHGASGAETRNAAQLEQITEQIQFAQSAPSPATQFKHPLFIRIPTAGTTLTPLDGLDIVNVHMASSPRADEGVQSLKTGFMADAELLDLISKIRAIGKPHFRRNTILQINDLFEQRIQSALAQQPGFNLENLDSLPWSFRYLTEKSDAELAAFMKAAVRTGNPQVIFTFYRDNTDVDIRHKTFLKQNFKFLDLQQQNNDALDTDSSVLIINLPPLSSGLFKALMASADTATVSGENSLLESLALNKFGVGPLPLFRPAIAEHLEILQAPLTSQNHSALLEKTLRYVQLDDAEPPDALARWNTETPVSPVENDLIAALNDPETQLFWKSALADIVAPVNGLNTLTSIIGELDRATPIPDIITTHNQAVQSDAYALADAFIDSPLDHTSSEGQQEFIESSLADFVKSIVMNAARRRLDATSIRPLLNTAVRHIVKRYNDSLHKLSPLAALQATQRFEQKLYTALAGIDIVGKGHLFIPFYRNGQLFYSYSFVDFNVFHPDPALRGIPVVRESTVSAPAKKRIAQDILDTQYVKSFLSFIAIQDALGAQYAKELPHTFSGTSDQIDQANDFIARTAVPLFRQTAQENAAVLTEHYGTASVAALYAYYFDYRSSISLADPGDNALIDRLTRITAALYQTPFDDNPTFFFRGNENGDWLTHMEDNLHTLIAQKTALHDFTLTARSIGASVGKEPYTQAAIIQNALRRFAYSSVYADTRMDKQKRDQLVEQWVDSWDVRIYAFERSFQRSITTQAGVYRVLPQENYFFTSPEGQNYISLFENGQTLPNPTEEFQRHGIISQRLKNWVIPVLSGDLSANPRILAEYPAEITFMMNMLTYLANDNARMNLYRFALDSSSTAYRSFVMYNETFDAPPSNHFILDELPYTIPPLTIPFLSHIDAVSQIIHSVDKPALSRELGVYTANRAHHYTFDDQRVEVQIAGTETRFIETGQFYSPSMLDGIVDDAIVDVYLQLYTLVSSLSVNPDSPEQTQEAQQQFAAQQLPEFLRQFILFMINKGIEENIMNDYIADAQKVLSSLYARTLRNTSEEFAQKMLFSWNDAIDSVFSGIEITEEFDIFIPFGHGLLFYLQYGIPVFNKDNPADDSVTAVTRIIPAHTKSRVISDSRDKAAIAEILQLFVFDEWFTLERFPSLRASWSKTPELYQSNSTHSMFIREHVAASLVPSFNRLVQNYAGLLTTHYGNATLDALRQFIIDAFIDTSLLDDPALIGSLTPDTAQRVKLASDIRAIIERLRDDREEDGQPSVTGFFRPASGWNEYTSTITGYFNDLILQKTARNDYSITIKDIGASTGKEALSIAAMLEASLLNYAHTTLFASIADAGARNQAVQNWVGRWDIRIYAFEQFPARLVPLAIGEYDILHRKEVEFFIDNPDYFPALFENSADKLDELRTLKEQIDASPDDILPIALTMRVKSRLLQWVIPVASDIRDIPELALNTPAEATFFLNTFYQLGFPEPLLEQLKSTAMPQYKSLFLYNRRTSDIPDTLGKIAGQDYVLPAQTQPSLEDISAFIATHHIYSADELNRIFGTPPAHLPAVHAADSAAAQLIAHYPSGSPLQFEQSVIDGIFHDALAPLVGELLKTDATPESIRAHFSLFKTYLQQNYFVRLSESRSKNVQDALDALAQNTDRYIAGITIPEQGHVFIPVPLLGKQGFDYIYVENQKFKQFLENRTTEFLAEHFDFHWSAENRISGDAPVIRSNRLTEQAKDELAADLRNRSYVRNLLDGFDFNALFRYHIADSLPRNFIKGEFLKPGFDIPAFSFETDPETANAIKDHLSEILLDYFNQLAQKHAALLLKRYNTADVRALSLTIASLRLRTDLDPAETALIEDYNRTAQLLADPYENGSARRKQNRFFSGKTRLFRKFEAWYKQYDNYLYDVIAQKAAAGDLTFRISSIGSSIGKEPYSLASLLERKLIQYARQNIFKENPADPRIQEWVDSWDIKVYAYDHSLQRLATSREGFYSLDGKIYNHTDSDLDFFAEHPAFLDMFSAVYYPDGNRTAAKAQTANRLQRWVRHRYLDLESDLSILQDTPSDVVFFMNVYPNLSEPVREDVLKAINRSLNLPYKSFFSYNTEIIGTPVEQSDIPGQPFVIAASTPPPLTLIETIRQENLTYTDERLTRYFGLQTADNAVHPQILFYNRFTAAIRSIHSGGIPDPDDFKRFIGTNLPVIVSDYIAYRLEFNPQFSPAEISQLINDAVILLNTYYEQYGIQQFRSQVSELAPLFARKLSEFAASISLPAQGHVIIPYFIHDTQQNRHIFIDSQPFHIDPNLRGTPTAVNESLSTTETVRLKNRLQNMRYVRALFDAAQIEINVQKHIAEKRIPSTFALNYDALTDALASVLFDRFKETATKHAQELERYSFKPTLEGLSQYYSFALKNVSVQEESPLFRELTAIFESVNANGNTGTTWFFRHGAQASRATLDFLRNLVAQKTTRADNTISLRSVGSSTGQEAYALASMVERALTDYAEQNLYPNNPQGVQDWINNWTVNIYAIDSVPIRHTATYYGVYTVAAEPFKVINDISGQLDLSIGSFSPVPDDSGMIAITVPERFKLWVKPVTADFGAQPDILKKYPAEVTYLNNILLYVPAQEVVEAAVDSPNRRYMSYVNSDEALTNYLPSLQQYERVFPGSRGYIVPPKELPAILNIMVFADTHNEWDENTLFTLFGLDESHREFLKAVFEIHDAVIQKFNTITGQGEPFARQLLESFAQNDFPLLVRDLVHSLLAHQESSEEITRHITYLILYTAGRFRTTLDDNAIPNAQSIYDRFLRLIKEYAASIAITEDSQVFLPVTRDGAVVYQHYFIDFRPFHPREELRNSPVVASIAVSEARKNRIIEETQQVQLLLPLLENDINFTELLGKVSVTAEDMARDRIGFFPFYSGNPRQIDKIKRSITQISISEFKQLQHTHRKLLEDEYGKASLENLVKLLTLLNSDAQYIDIPRYSAVLNDYLAIVGRIKTIDAFGYTEFFRQSHNWLAELESFLDDLIREKAALGDFTITAKSIGSSYGKELISIGGVIEKRLVHYARHTLFTPAEPASSERMQAWLDRWDVTLQAYDMSYLRMASMMQGVFLESIVGYDTGGYEFLRGAGTEYATIFSTVHDHEPLTGKGSSGDIVFFPTFSAVINPRILSWIQAVPVNLQENPEVIAETPAEIMFSMNVMWYFAQGSEEKSNPLPLEQPQQLINAIHNAANPQYKTFAAYNGTINSAPKEHRSVLSQKYVLPPAEYPDADILFHIISSLNLREAKEISRIMGFSYVQDRVFTALFRTFNGFIASYFSPNRLLSYTLDSSDSIAQLRQLLIRTLLTLSQLDISTDQLNRHRTVLVERLIYEFSARIAAIVESGQMNAQTAQNQNELFSRIIQSIADSIIILPEGNLIIPSSTEGFSELFYVDWQAFSLNKTLRGSPVTASYLIQDSAVQSIRNDIEDIPIAIEILTFITGDFLVLYPAKDMPQGYDAMNSYNNGQHQQYLVNLAKTYLSELRQLTSLFADELADSYGAANLGTLYELMQDRYELFQAGKLFHPIINDIARINASIQTPDQEYQAYDGAPDSFFLHANWWVDDLSEFLSHVIAQKNVRNDLTLTVRSVGSSTGEEAYSVAAVIEKALSDYAQSSLFNGLPAELQQQQTEQWVDRWHVEIHLYDSHPYRLASSLEGIYTLDTLDAQWIEQQFPNFAGIIEERDRLDDRRMRIRIKPRLRNWMHPHQIDLNQQTPSHRAEITVAMNSLMFFGRKREDSLIAELMQSCNPLYKSYFLHNRHLRMEPEPIDEISGQPFTVQPLNPPDFSAIDTFIQQTGISSEEELTRIFGLTEYQRGIISSYTRMRPIAEEFLALMNEHLTAVIRPGSVDDHRRLLADAQTEHNRFMELISTAFFTDVTAELVKQGKSPNEIRSHFNVFSQILMHRYRAELLEAHHPLAQHIAAHFQTGLSAFLSSIQIENGSFFIPDVSDGKAVVREYAVDWRAFYPDETLRALPRTIHIATLAPEQVPARIEAISEISAAKRILELNGFIDFPAVFDSWDNPPDDTVRNRVGFLPFYDGTPAQNETLKNHVAELALEELKKIAADFSGIIPAANTPVLSLAAYLSEIGFNLGTYPAEALPLIRRMETLRNRITTYDSIGYTEFFRNVFYWQTNFNNYLQDIIAQKTALNDLTLSVKSIGASYGKEAYSIAALIAYELAHYARAILFAGNPNRDVLTREWVDSWNISIYAFEKDYQKLATLQEGVYLIKGSDVNYTDYHTLFREMPGFIDLLFADSASIVRSSYSGERGFASIVNRRFKKWVVPVPADLGTDEGRELVKRYPAEIAFAMNILPYFNPATTPNNVQPVTADTPGVRELLGAINESFNPHYKSFFMYDLDGMRAVGHSLIPSQEFSLPPRQFPSFEAIHATAQQTGADSAGKLRSIMGITVLYADVFNAYFNLRPHLEELIHTFSSEPSFRNDFASITGQERFMATVFIEFVRSYSMELAIQQPPSDEISAQFAFIPMLLSAYYQDKLAELGIENAAELRDAFRRRLRTAVNGVVFSHGHVFIETPFETDTIYEHRYIDYQLFHPDPERQGKPVVVSEYISQRKYLQLAAGLDDIPSVIRILDILDFDRQFNFAAFELRLASGLNIDGAVLGGRQLSRNQLDAIKQSIATASLDFFRALATLHTPELTQQYGQSVQALAQYLANDLNTPHANPQIKTAIEAFSRDLFREQSYGPRNTTASETYFFRDAALFEAAEKYLEELIVTKMARNDYQFSLRSLGSSTGQEAVTLAALTHSVLQKFALKLYDSETEQQKWIARWDYTVYAVDIALPRFLPLIEGTYSLESLNDISIFHTKPELYSELFAFHSHSIAELGELYEELSSLSSGDAVPAPALPYQRAVKTVVSPAIRNRIQVVYGDLRNNPGLFIRTRSNVTFSMNLLALFGPDSEIDEQQATADQEFIVTHARASSEPSYKGFFAFNTSRNSTAERLNQTPNEPQAIPPATAPSLLDIRNAVKRMEDFGITPAPETTNALFGLTETQSASVSDYFMLNEQARRVIENIADLQSENARQRAIEDILAPFSIDYVTRLLPQAISEDALFERLVFFTELLVDSFRNAAAEKLKPNADVLAGSFERQIIAYMNTFELIEGHLFIKTEFEGAPLYEHRYADMQLFHPDPAIRNTARIVREFVSQEKRREILEEIADAEQVTAIFGLLDFDANFSVDRFSTDSYYAPAELSSSLYLDDRIADQQHAAIKHGLAVITTRFFRGLAEKYADRLAAFAGTADLRALFLYLEALNTRKVRNDELLAEIMNFQDTLYQDRYYYTEYSYGTGAGTMFLDLPPLRPNLENYVRDLAIQKMARGDFSFSLRSLGASSGREALVLAAVTDQVLNQIAEQLYDNPDDREKWVARWNYTVYANDLIPVRMLPLFTGNYLIDNTDEVKAFLDNPDFYQSLFTYRSHTADDLAEIHQAFMHAHESRANDFLPLDFTMPLIRLVASPHLLNRIAFYSGSIENNPALYETTRGNATVLMNTLLYLSEDFPNITPEEAERQLHIVRQLDDNTDPEFKSFFMVNNDQPDPVILDFFPQQPYVKPPVRIPSFDIINRTAEVLEQLNQEVTADTLARIIGLTQDNAHIAETYLAFRNGAREAFETFFATISGVPDTAGHVRFIHSALRNFAVQFSMQSIISGTPADTVESYLDILPAIGKSAFIKATQHFGLPYDEPAADAFADTVRQMVELLEIHGNDIFIPTSIDGRPAYLHYFIEQIPPHPLASLRTPHSASELIPAAVKNRILQDIKDVESARNFYTEITDKTIGRENSFFIIDYLRMLSSQFEETIFSATGATGIDGLTAFAAVYRDEIRARMQETDTPLIREIKQFVLNISHGTMPWQRGDAYVEVSAETYFFRHQAYWAPFIETVRQTVSDLIARQIAAGDYSLRLESIGASTGKEAYSLAAITENALRSYAENLYRDSADKDTLVEQWLDSWDIQITAMDKSLSPLAIAKNGVYLIESVDEIMHLINDFPHMLSYSSAPLQDYTNRLFKKEIQDFEYDQVPSPKITVAVSNRLKRWVHPIYGDVLSNPSLLEQSDAQVSVYMNTHRHLMKQNAQQAHKIMEVLSDRTNTRLKRLVIMNDEFDVPPTSLNELEGHPYIKPPSGYPTASEINAVAVASGIFSEQRLADIFGITVEELVMILDEALTEIIPGSLVDKLRWNREYTDSML